MREARLTQQLPGAPLAPGAMSDPEHQKAVEGLRKIEDTEGLRKAVRDLQMRIGDEASAIDRLATTIDGALAREDIPLPERLKNRAALLKIAEDAELIDRSAKGLHMTEEERVEAQAGIGSALRAFLDSTPDAEARMRTAADRFLRAARGMKTLDDVVSPASELALFIQGLTVRIPQKIAIPENLRTPIDLLNILVAADLVSGNVEELRKKLTPEDAEWKCIKEEARKYGQLWRQAYRYLEAAFLNSNSRRKTVFLTAVAKAQKIIEQIFPVQEFLKSKGILPDSEDMAEMIGLKDLRQSGAYTEAKLRADKWEFVELGKKMGGKYDRDKQIVYRQVAQESGPKELLQQRGKISETEVENVRGEKLKDKTREAEQKARDAAKADADQVGRQEFMRASGGGYQSKAIEHVKKDKNYRKQFLENMEDEQRQNDALKLNDPRRVAPYGQERVIAGRNLKYYPDLQKKASRQPEDTESMLARENYLKPMRAWVEEHREEQWFKGQDVQVFMRQLASLEERFKDYLAAREGYAWNTTISGDPLAGTMNRIKWKDEGEKERAWEEQHARYQARMDAFPGDSSAGILASAKTLSGTLNGLRAQHTPQNAATTLASASAETQPTRAAESNASAASSLRFTSEQLQVYKGRVAERAKNTPYPAPYWLALNAAGDKLKDQFAAGVEELKKQYMNTEAAIGVALVDDPPSYPALMAALESVKKEIAIMRKVKEAPGVRAEWDRGGLEHSEARLNELQVKHDVLSFLASWLNVKRQVDSNSEAARKRFDAQLQGSLTAAGLKFNKEAMFGVADPVDWYLPENLRSSPKGGMYVEIQFLNRLASPVAQQYLPEHIREMLDRRRAEIHRAWARASWLSKGTMESAGAHELPFVKVPGTVIELEKERDRRQEFYEKAKKIPEAKVKYVRIEGGDPWDSYHIEAAGTLFARDRHGKIWRLNTVDWQWYQMESLPSDIQSPDDAILKREFPDADKYLPPAVKGDLVEYASIIKASRLTTSEKTGNRFRTQDGNTFFQIPMLEPGIGGAMEKHYSGLWRSVKNCTWQYVLKGERLMLVDKVELGASFYFRYEDRIPVDEDGNEFSKGGNGLYFIEGELVGLTTDGKTWREFSMKEEKLIAWMEKTPGKSLKVVSGRLAQWINVEQGTVVGEELSSASWNPSSEEINAVRREARKLRSAIKLVREQKYDEALKLYDGPGFRVWVDELTLPLDWEKHLDKEIVLKALQLSVRPECLSYVTAGRGMVDVYAYIDGPFKRPYLVGKLTLNRDGMVKRENIEVDKEGAELLVRWMQELSKQMENPTSEEMVLAIDIVNLLEPQMRSGPRDSSLVVDLNRAVEALYDRYPMTAKDLHDRMVKFKESLKKKP